MVGETDSANLEVGQKAVIAVDAFEGVEMDGEVTEIGASAIVRGSDTSQAQAQLGANTGNQPKDFKVKIVLEDPPANLRPGLNASADITTTTRNGVLAVPIQAVVVREVDEDGDVIESGAAGADSDDTLENSATADRASILSESSTRGQTMNTWFPAATAAAIATSISSSASRAAAASW